MALEKHSSWENQLINTLDHEHLARSLKYRTQTDLLILHFSKAFDSVAHKRLLLKLDFYGIRVTNFGLAAGVAGK